MQTVVSVPATTTAPGTTYTFAKAKKFVARAVNRNPPDSELAEAGEFINLAIDEMNRRRPWKWLQAVHSDITVSADDDTYSLPSDINHIYSVRLTGTSDRTLEHVEHRDIGRAIDSDLASYKGTPTHYSTFLSGETNQIVLFPVPDATETLRIRYVKLVTRLALDTETLNFPQKWQAAVLYKARALMLADRDAEKRRLDLWVAEAERAFRQARADDATRPDRNPRLKPGQEYYYGNERGDW